MRVLIDDDPFLADNSLRGWRERGDWPASWVGCAGATTPFVAAFRCVFAVDAPTMLRLHVSADERYDLYLDGVWLGCGPERGAPDMWFFETYDIALDAGEHCLVARVWAAGAGAATAQMSVRPGWLCAAEGPLAEQVATGRARWDAMLLGGYTWLKAHVAPWRADRVSLDAAGHPWGWQYGNGDAWQPVIDFGSALGRRSNWEFPLHHLLRPASLPPQLALWRRFGNVRYLVAAALNDIRPVNLAEGLDTSAWQTLVDADTAVPLMPNTSWHVVFDLETYECAYPEITLAGGKGAIMQLHWAEALRYHPDPWRHEKGRRDLIEGKYFMGFGDTFVADGGERRLMPLWWNAGRYLELRIQTGDEPLLVRRLALRTTRYPLEDAGSFAAADERLARLTPLLVRGMQMCAHETFMDCPFYEELQYAGDTRLELLTAYVMTQDARLARKALLLFDTSRIAEGLTHSRYPSRQLQIIAPFSLWWAAMVCDYAHWRDDLATVQQCMPGVRAVLDAFERYRRADGLLGAPNGWNFMDWVPEWDSDAGAPPTAATQPSAVLGWQLVYVQRMVADLEEALGELEMAARWRRLAAQGAQALDVFWNAARGMYADDLAQQYYSEHTQCLALLSGMLRNERFAMVAENLVSAADLARTTIYFSHYLFEAYRVIGLSDRILAKLEHWHGLLEQGFVTPVEKPEPSRSDCHAWGSHPLFHLRATILGIRPAALWFRHVTIAPQLGGLAWARGSLPHPNGTIAVDVRQEDTTLYATISLPTGVTGTLVWAGQMVAIVGTGEYRLACEHVSM
jgi:alpha-L-rhamnosidase